MIPECLLTKHNEEIFFLGRLNISLAKSGSEKCAKFELLKLTNQQAYQANKDVAAARRTSRTGPSVPTAWTCKRS